MSFNEASLFWCVPLARFGRPALLIARKMLSSETITWFNIMWKRESNHFGADSKPIGAGLTLEHRIPYGEAAHEVLDDIRPTATPPTPDGVSGRTRRRRSGQGVSDGGDGVAVYFPGGGFVTSNCVTLNQCMTPLARAGYRVFAVDYPLAPENPYPAPILSALRALAWIKRRTGAERVALIGDSAGGQIATFVAALLTSDSLLPRFAAQAGVADLPSWDLPGVSHVVSIYGHFDSQSALSSAAYGRGLLWCWASYQGVPMSAAATPPSAPSDLPRHLLEVAPAELRHTFPPTLLLVGNQDPLYASTRATPQCTALPVHPVHRAPGASSAPCTVEIAALCARACCRRAPSSRMPSSSGAA